MKSLLKLKDSCVGKSAIFIGLGCSINQFDLSQIDREKYKLISMNFWYPYGPQKFGIDVDYYISGDYINVFTKNYLDSWKRDNLKDFGAIINEKNSYCEKKLSKYMNNSPVDWILNNKSYLKTKIILIKPEIDYLKYSIKKEKNPGKIRKSLKRIEIIRSLNTRIQKDSSFNQFYGTCCQSFSTKTIYRITNKNIIFNNRFHSGFSAYILPFIQFLGFKDLTIMGLDISKAGHFFFDLTEMYHMAQSKPDLIQRFGYDQAIDDLKGIRPGLKFKIKEVDPENYPYYFGPKIFSRLKFKDLCVNSYKVINFNRKSEKTMIDRYVIVNPNNPPPKSIEEINKIIKTVGNNIKYPIFLDTKTNLVQNIDYHIDWHHNASIFKSSKANIKPYNMFFAKSVYTKPHDPIQHHERLVTSNNNIENFYGKSALVVAGGESTGLVDLSDLKTDFVFSCNHFFLRKEIMNLGVTDVILCNEINTARPALKQWIEKNQKARFWFENHKAVCQSFIELYSNPWFYFTPDFKGKIGTGVKLLVLAANLGCNPIYYVGLDGGISKHYFQPGKTKSGTKDTHNLEIQKMQFLMLVDYLSNHVKACAYNLGEGFNFNLMGNFSQYYNPLPPFLKELQREQLRS